MILHLENRYIETDLKFSIFSDTQKINSNDWNKIVLGKNIYLTLPYLSAMEKSLGSEMRFRYILFYNEKKIPVAVAVVQFLHFIDKGYNDKQEVCRLRNVIKRFLFTTKGIEMMTCGSPFSSGENGFAFSDSVSANTAYTSLGNALIHLQKTDKQVGKVPIKLYKELLPHNFSWSNFFHEKGFSEFFVDVNMIMKIAPSWKNQEDYLQSMVTKFRTKAKTALRKSESLEVIDLDTDRIEANKVEIEKLYLKVLDKSSFQFGALNGDSFLNLKRNLGNEFIVKGYFLNKKLVGFSSSFIFNSILDANYVGIDYELNQEYAIYQRMLYDYIELAIQRQCTELRFGRTAEEIKSSVGAVPVPMKLFIRHRNPIANRILRSIVKTIKPSEFELRKPFKVEFSQKETIAN